MRKKYKNPPIVETVCEFQFVPSQPWDITIPGLVYEKIRHSFPNKKQLLGFGLSIQTKEAGKAEQKIEQKPPRMQFISPDGLALVQVGPDLLAVNHLKPYPTWEVFRPLIEDNLKIYQEVARPNGFKRIGLRYINKIEIHEEVITLSEYFKCGPQIPEGLAEIHEAFNVRVEIPYEDGRERLILILASTVSEKPNVSPFLLDFDYMLRIPESLTISQAPEWIEKAHRIIAETFETCITDKCRSLFGEGS